ncbi:MAG: FmdB family zinc ribbon protein [Gordonia sp. (in: high G+C Gram-positive bacteria)]|uniref:FmdB family zinc ribbon protein n=1 Tax=Gordonia TaxID=2053 RepID=UPI003263E804
MPVYQFHCADCGCFEAAYPMSDVPDAAACACGVAARRRMSSPALARRGAAMAALDATASTAHAPAVVDRIPPGRRRPAPVSTDPRHARLPRP